MIKIILAILMVVLFVVGIYAMGKAICHFQRGDY